MAHPSFNVKYGMPDEFRFPEPVAIVPGITEDDLNVLAFGTLPSPSVVGQQISVLIQDYANTFVDTTMSFIWIRATLVMQQTGATTPLNGPWTGAFIGSFWSIFSRYTVSANSTTPTDDMPDIGVTAAIYLRLTMSITLRESLGYLLGFNTDPEGYDALLGARTGAASFPWTSGGQTPNTPLALTWPQNGFLTQVYDICLPVFGTLGTGNKSGLYYLGLGTTRIDFILEDWNRWLAICPLTTTPVPLAVVGANAVVGTPAQVAANGVGNGGLIKGAGFSLGGVWTVTSFTVNYLRFMGKVIRFDLQTMATITSQLRSPNFITRQTVFLMSTANLAAGISGTQQILCNAHGASVTALLTLFNNGLQTFTAQGNVALAGETLPFNKYGSVNPNLIQGTAFSINNRLYPQQGFDPTNFPAQTYAMCVNAIHSLWGSGSKPSIAPGNYMVIDHAGNPMAGIGGNGAPAATNPAWRWRSGSYVVSGALNATGAAPAANMLTGASDVVTAFISEHEYNAFQFNTLIGSKRVKSNDFFLCFDLETVSRPGYISGTPMNTGSNFLNMNISPALGASYTIYFILMCDGILNQNLQDGTINLIK